ncbi:MAG: tRNA/rRNA methyltransferase [uncultured bacterium]|nr:MAG: tRNA/rRNA methyltransferase [uncultured bacterium]
MKLNAQELRQLKENSKIPSLKRNPIYLILDNIYDTYNIGGLFRLADALNMKKIYLCGQTEIPPNSKIKKASIGTYKIVPWEYKKSAVEVIEELRKINNPSITITAIEQHPSSISYFKAEYKPPIALILGNETFGISQEALKLADMIVEIPMFGINKSLNVIVSAGIIGYHIYHS